ncbi:threonine/serine ThrE exporter family protein, partial [Clostridium acetireducens]|uniref:threonine/serine ThrE exporter family protein n=1 Tax=Clostridium acetireducens TaxID=76489 RepID=UPI000AD0944B
MDINRVIHIAVEAGRIMLENGAETYRVEETIYRICNAYNINEADSFVTPTGIMVSVANNYGQTISLIKRIKVRTVDLEKISLINDLSRSITIEAITLDSFEENLKKIDNEKKYSNS